MKTFTLFLAGAILLFSATSGSAQPDTARIKLRVLLFADSLVKTDSFQNWNAYANLTQESVIKHYGGKDGFIQHILPIRAKRISDIAEAPAELTVQSLMTENEQWQCVVRESRYFHKGDQVYHLTTYFIGQSKDEGETWKLFDVGYNSVANIIYMFPDIFGDLPIQETTVYTPAQEQAAKEKAELQANGGVKKGTTAK